jgi:hypothetical protein
MAEEKRFQCVDIQGEIKVKTENLHGHSLKLIKKKEKKKDIKIINTPKYTFFHPILCLNLLRKT